MQKFLSPLKSYFPTHTRPFRQKLSSHALHPSPHPHTLLRRHYHEGLKNKVYLVCLTGGPCAGKTTALASIMTHFSSKFTV
jgi:chorismate-pyruvate lyase